MTFRQSLPKETEEREKAITRIIKGLVGERKENQADLVKLMVQEEFIHYFLKKTTIGELVENLDTIELFTKNMEHFSFLHEWSHACLTTQVLQHKLIMETAQLITEHYGSVDEQHNRQHHQTMLEKMASQTLNVNAKNTPDLIVNVLLSLGASWKKIEANKEVYGEIWEHIQAHPVYKRQTLESFMKTTPSAVKKSKI